MTKSVVSHCILPLAILLSVVSTFFVIFQFSQVESTLKETTFSSFEASVDAGYDIIDTTVNEAIKTYLKVIAEVSKKNVMSIEKSHLLSALDTEKLIHDTLASIKIGESGYAYMLNESGSLIHHPFLQGDNVGEYAFIKQQMVTNSIFVEYEWRNPEDKKARKKVAYSVQFEDGRILVVSTYKDELLYLIDQEVLKSKLSEHKFGESGYIYVMNSDGKLLLHPTHQGKPVQDLIGDHVSELVTKAQKFGRGVDSYELNINGKYLEKEVVFRYYPYLDWIIALGIERRELYKHTNVLIGSIIAVLMSFVCIISTLMVLLNNRHKKLLDVQKLDYLTGLRNRRCFIEQVSSSLNRSGQSNYAIILFDIDFFKLVNDTHGHKQGDTVIRTIAKVIQQHDSKNVISARYGGEEFILFVRDMDKHDVFMLAENIRAKIQNIRVLCKQVTVSGGVHIVNESNCSLEQATALADNALYQAKQQGRNQVVSSCCQDGCREC